MAASWSSPPWAARPFDDGLPRPRPGSFTWLASYATGVVVSMWKESPLLRDAGADMLTVGAVMAVLDFREEVGDHYFLDQRKNVINTVTNPSDLCYGCHGDC
nr:uncharacterized protein LOC120964260 [Aegilops tauschii subsp. strangulata]